MRHPFFIFSGLILTFFIGSTLTAQQIPSKEKVPSLEPWQIMERVAQRDHGQTMISDLTIVLKDEHNNSYVRKAKVFRKTYKQGQKLIFFFVDPPELKKASLLLFDWDKGREDETWLYLPETSQANKISEKDAKHPFVKSDFLHKDLKVGNVKEWNYTFINTSVPVGGHDCWMIEATPKDEKRKKDSVEKDYQKRQIWIRKDIFMIVREKMWMDKNKKIKYFAASDIRNNEGVWGARNLTMVSRGEAGAERSTILLFENQVYNQPIDDKMFTQESMKQGLPEEQPTSKK